jgi:hypothetical protein
MPSDEEKHLYYLSKHTGWKILKEDIDSSLKGFDLATEKQIADGASFEEIGKNVIVINLARAVINKILNRVKDAVEACEAEDGK